MGYSMFACERELETEQNCNILTPPLMTVGVVSFSFSRAAQPEAQDGFLYCILSATSLDPNSSGAPRAPSAWCGFPYHILSATPAATVWHFVLTELYNSSTPTQSPTRSLEWHVWSSSSGNNCHRSLSSGASVYECTMGIFTSSHLISLNPPTWSLSITGHWNVSLPSGASLLNGMFARAEGQNTIYTSCSLTCDVSEFVNIGVFQHKTLSIWGFWLSVCIYSKEKGREYNMLLNIKKLIKHLY